MVNWVKRTHGKGVIDKAGAILIPWWTTIDAKATDEIAAAFSIVENWRSSHGFPLNTFQMGLRQRAKKIETNVVVAQRLKRFSSIMNKLAREPNMKLSQMQDLGGCRAIVSTALAAERLCDQYRGDATLFSPSEGKLKVYDYINNPKVDGYRGIHVVGRYHATSKVREPWNGQRIEIQLRSRLQHAFGTAVETVTTFTKAPLKFGSGPPDWRRFFSLMGSAIAIREGTPIVPDTPSDVTALVAELKERAKSIKVRSRLRGWANALQQMPKKDTAGANWLLLVLDTAANTISVTGYAEARDGVAAYGQAESAVRAQNQPRDVVLVSLASVTDLKEAYPNYYADTTEFLKALDAALELEA